MYFSHLACSDGGTEVEGWTLLCMSGEKFWWRTGVLWSLLWSSALKNHPLDGSCAHLWSRFEAVFGRAPRATLQLHIPSLQSSSSTSKAPKNTLSRPLEREKDLKTVTLVGSFSLPWAQRVPVVGFALGHP